MSLALIVERVHRISIVVLPVRVFDIRLHFADSPPPPANSSGLLAQRDRLNEDTSNSNGVKCLQLSGRTQSAAVPHGR